MIVSHGDIIRIPSMHITNTHNEETPDLGVIPTGTAIIYELDGRMNPVRQEYLGRANRS